MKKAVIMCMQMRNIEVSPARYQMINEMDKLGFEVYLFLRGKLDKKAEKTCSGIQHFLNTESMSNKEIRENIIEYKPDIVIAFTYEDTDILYSLPKHMKDTKFYYFNLEISTPGYYLQSRKRNTLSYWVKKVKYPVSICREAFYTKQCEFLVIQDEERKKIAAKYHISHRKTMLIPNSYIYNKDIEYNAEREGIIYSGGAREKYLKDYMSGFYAVKSVPIVFAGTFDKWSKIELIKLHRANSNIKMEQQTLDSDEYTKYLQKYAVGLVCYSKSDDDNIAHIGLSSGKFFKHLSLGQPVITIGSSRLSREVQKYGLGIAVDDASQIEGAYKQIMDRYNFYRENVIRTYQNRYDFRKSIRTFLAHL